MSEFLQARIKKIMQADEDVGKIALAVPVLVCESLTYLSLSFFFFFFFNFEIERTLFFNLFLLSFYIIHNSKSFGIVLTRPL